LFTILTNVYTARKGHMVADGMGKFGNRFVVNVGLNPRVDVVCEVLYNGGFP
jgi:hypothetical protein